MNTTIFDIDPCHELSSDREQVNFEWSEVDGIRRGQRLRCADLDHHRNGTDPMSQGPCRRMFVVICGKGFKTRDRKSLAIM